MTDCAMHVQHKDREIFDRQNRVIPTNVIAVSTDTGEIRLGDGVKSWRDLPFYGAADGEPSEEPDEGYSGPLHVVVYSPTELDTLPESTEVMARVPSSNEMVVLGATGFVIGNGVDSLGELPLIVPSSQEGGA